MEFQEGEPLKINEGWIKRETQENIPNHRRKGEPEELELYLNSEVPMKHVLVDAKAGEWLDAGCVGGRLASSHKNSQKPGICFNKAFAPVARTSTMRIVTALAVCFGMPIRQLDVATACINGKLKEEIFMELPKLFRKIPKDIVVSEAENSELKVKAMNSSEKLLTRDIVCRLNKSLYGLCRAGRTWFSTIDSIHRPYDAKLTTSDH
ncbi:hypothetical protein Trydic_g20118 [Trypoxylus dichotomus]